MNSTHVLGGAAGGAWLGVMLQPVPVVALAGTALGAIGAALPDLDHLDSSPVRMFTNKRIRIKPWRILGWTIRKSQTIRVGIGPLVSWTLRLLSRILVGVKHRGVTHSLAFGVVVGCVVTNVAENWLTAGQAVYFGISTFVGVATALLGDLITKASLNHLFWPLSIKIKIPRWMRIQINKFAEKLIRWLLGPVTALGLAQLLLGGPA
jgi:membrane-bound metal-dependent hydrolase YbcI (DUF457 family)